MIATKNKTKQSSNHSKDRILILIIITIFSSKPIKLIMYKILNRKSSLIRQIMPHSTPGTLVIPLTRTILPELTRAITKIYLLKSSSSKMLFSTSTWGEQREVKLIWEVSHSRIMQIKEFHSQTWNSKHNNSSRIKQHSLKLQQSQRCSKSRTRNCKKPWQV